MKTKHLLFVLALSTIGQIAIAQSFEWAKQIDGINSNRGNSIAVDASGNVYTTGYFRDTADFDPGADTFNLSSAGHWDVFISKLDAAGNFVWAKQIGGVGFAEGWAIAVDALGNVYTTGYFQGTADFDPGTDTVSFSSVGGRDAFVSKLDASGNFVWAKQMSGTGFTQGYSIAVDASGNVYTTGYLAGTADFDPGDGTFNLSSAGDQDAFISKLDDSGNFVWAKKIGETGQMPGTHFAEGWSIFIDRSGNIYTTGAFIGTVDFDPGDGTFNLSSAGDKDIFISKLDTSGNLEWVKQIGGTDPDVGYSIAVDTLGNVYTTGGFQGTVDFDPGDGTFDLSTVGFQSGFITKLDALGNFVWAKQTAGTGLAIGHSIALDASGNIYTTGAFQGTVDFDPGAGTFDLTSAGHWDVFTSKSDASGNLVWATQMGGTSPDYGLSLALDASGNIYTTGAFRGTVDFDPGAGTFDLTSAGDINSFVHKMSQTTTGVSVNFFDKEFIVYPNPTSGQINIALGENTSKIAVIVRNYLGQEILRKSYTSTDTIELTIEGAAGLYLLEIREKDKRVIAKVVKY